MRIWVLTLPSFILFKVGLWQVSGKFNIPSTVMGKIKGLIYYCQNKNQKDLRMSRKTGRLGDHDRHGN